MFISSINAVVEQIKLWTQLVLVMKVKIKKVCDLQKEKKTKQSNRLFIRESSEGSPLRPGHNLRLCLCCFFVCFKCSFSFGK